MNCVVCGAVVAAPEKGGVRKYCSHECQRVVHRQKEAVWRDARRESLRDGYRRNYAKHAERYRAEKRLWFAEHPAQPKERECAMCGKAFWEVHASKFCSKRCQRDHANERKAGRRVDHKPKRSYPDRRVEDAPRLCAACGDAFISKNPAQKVCSAVWCQTKRKRVEVRLWTDANHERFNEWQRAHRKKYPERYKANARDFYLRHRAEVLEDARRYYENNRERTLAQAAKYHRGLRAAVLWWREHVGPAKISDAPRIIAALREVEHADRSS